MDCMSGEKGNARTFEQANEISTYEATYCRKKDCSVYVP